VILAAFEPVSYDRPFRRPWTKKKNCRDTATTKFTTRGHSIMIREGEGKFHAHHNVRKLTGF
jgi:hypothetical protein